LQDKADAEQLSAWVRPNGVWWYLIQLHLLTVHCCIMTASDREWTRWVLLLLHCIPKKHPRHFWL